MKQRGAFTFHVPVRLSRNPQKTSDMKKGCRLNLQPFLLRSQRIQFFSKKPSSVFGQREMILLSSPVVSVPHLLAQDKIQQNRTGV